MEKKKDESKENEDEMTSKVLKAIESGDVRALKKLVDKNKIDLKNIIEKDTKKNPFFSASKIPEDSNALNTFKYLKSKGVNPSQKDINEQTCLFDVIKQGKNLCCKYLVLDCNVDINAIDIYGHTPIFYCIKEKKSDTLKTLISLGASVNKEDKDGESALYYAIRERDSELMEIIMENGATINTFNKKRQTPYMIAKELKEENLCELLVEYGANTNLENEIIYKEEKDEKKKPNKKKGDKKKLNNKNSNKNKKIINDDMNEEEENEENKEEESDNKENDNDDNDDKKEESDEEQSDKEESNKKEEDDKMEIENEEESEENKEKDDDDDDDEFDMKDEEKYTEYSEKQNQKNKEKQKEKEKVKHNKKPPNKNNKNKNKKKTPIKSKHKPPPKETKETSSSNNNTAENNNNNTGITTRSGAKLKNTSTNNNNNNTNTTTSNDKTKKKEPKEVDKWLPQKFYLVKIEKDQKIPLTNEELEIFIKSHEDIYNLLIDPKKRTRLRRNLRYQKNYIEHKETKEEKDKEEKEEEKLEENSITWEENAKKIMSMLWKLKSAEIFHEPVDPEELGVPDYFEVVKKPMDFSKINEKLKNGKYKNFKQFENDINLTFDNCILYNGEKSYVGKLCNEVKKYYEKYYKQFNMDQFK